MSGAFMRRLETRQFSADGDVRYAHLIIRIRFILTNAPPDLEKIVAPTITMGQFRVAEERGYPVTRHRPGDARLIQAPRLRNCLSPDERTLRTRPPRQRAPLTEKTSGGDAPQSNANAAGVAEPKQSILFAPVVVLYSLCVTCGPIETRRFGIVPIARVSLTISHMSVLRSAWGYRGRFTTLPQSSNYFVVNPQRLPLRTGSLTC